MSDLTALFGVMRQTADDGFRLGIHRYIIADPKQQTASVTSGQRRPVHRLRTVNHSVALHRSFVLACSGDAEGATV